MKQTIKSMGFSTVFALITIISLVMGASAADAKKKPTYNWKLSTQDAKGIPLADSAYRFAEKVEKLSDGDIKITVYASSQLGDYTQSFEEVQLGTIEMAWISGSSSFDRMIDIQGIPYLVQNWEQAAELWGDRDGFIYKLWEKTMKGLDVKLLGINPGGFLGCGGKNFGDLGKVMTPTVKKDVLLRVPAMELAVKIVNALGYKTTTIPYADLYAALQTGVADGWYGGSATLNYDGFRDVINTFIDYNYLFEIFGMFMNQELFDSLPPKYQELLTKAAIEEQAEAFVYYQVYAEKSYQNLEKYGIKVLKPTPEEMSNIADHVRSVVYPDLDEMFGAEAMKGIQEQVANLK